MSKLNLIFGAFLTLIFMQTFSMNLEAKDVKYLIHNMNSVKSTKEKQCGSISVQSEIDSRSSFTITIPLAK
jgi:chemotaxis protein histidine kinase CheA